jgi:hypothetical protein
MGGFQKTVLIIALVILLIVLLVVGGSLMAAKANPTWPPMVPNCPDWWVSDGSGNASRCLNPKSLGTCSEKYMDFNKSVFTGDNGACAKYKWASKCNVAWDGITYGVNNPCSS